MLFSEQTSLPKCLLTVMITLILSKSSITDDSTYSDCRQVIKIGRRTTEVSTVSSLFPSYAKCGTDQTTRCLLTFRGKDHLRSSTKLCINDNSYYIRCKNDEDRTRITISSNLESRMIKCGSHARFKICAEPNADLYVLFEAPNLCSRDDKNFRYGEIKLVQQPAYPNLMHLVDTKHCHVGKSSRESLKITGTIISIYRPDWSEEMFFCPAVIHIRHYGSKKFCLEFMTFYTFRGGAVLSIARDDEYIEFSAEHGIPESNKVCLKVHDYSNVKIKVVQGAGQAFSKPHSFVFKYYPGEEPKKKSGKDDDDDDNDDLYWLFVIPGVVLFACYGWCCYYCCKDDDDEAPAPTTYNADTEAITLDPISPGFAAGADGDEAVGGEEFRPLAVPSAPFDMPPPPMPSTDAPPSYNMLFPNHKN